MKCQKCEKELIGISRVGEVSWGACSIDENGNFSEFGETKGFGEETKTLFCEGCKTFYTSYLGVAHDDTDEYVQMQEEVRFDDILRELSETMENSAECINFFELKKVCEIIEEDVTKVVQNIAYRIVDRQRPIVTVTFRDDRDEIAF